MAEVLITLGIIGVVAAMTLPTLIENYQKTVLVAQLKKEINTISNVFKLALATEEVDKLNDTSSSMSGTDNRVDSSALLKKYAKIYILPKNSVVYNNFESEFGGSFEEIYVFNDGSCVASNGYWNADNRKVYGFELAIDTNCEKGPNKSGRDIFSISFNNDGSLFLTMSEYFICPLAMSSTDKDEMYSNLAEAFGVTKEEIKDLLETEHWEDANSQCYYEIIRSGWKMNY